MIDFAQLAASTTVSKTDAMPAAERRNRAIEANPFVPLVEAAAKDGKRRDLPGTFSMKAYPGRKNANESATVVSKLHAAGREVGVKLSVRRFDVKDESCRLAFCVVTDSPKGAKK